MEPFSEGHSVRVLLAGPLSIEYIADSWVEPLQRLYDCDCVDVAPLTTTRGKATHEEYLLRVIQKGDYDVLFFYSDGVNHRFGDDIFSAARRRGIITLTYHADDEPETWYLRNIPYDHRFDLIATHSLRGYERRLQAGFGQRALYLPWGFNPRAWPVASYTSKDIDIIYVGSNHGQMRMKAATPDADALLYYGEGYWRQQLLCHLVKAAQSRGWMFRIFGAGWDNHPELGPVAGGIVSHDDMVRLYNRSKIVLNLGWSADADSPAPQVKLRHFEVPGCGAFQLSNRIQELALQFTPNEEIDFFDGPDDLIAKAAWHLSHDQARERIALAGHHRALREHTTDHRVNTLFARVAELHPSPVREKEPIKSRASIQTIYVRDTEHLRELASNPGALDTLSQAHALHFVDSNWPGTCTVDYSILSRWITTTPCDIYGVRCFVEVDNANVNKLQRRGDDLIGTVVPECATQQTVDPLLLESLRRNLLHVENPDHQFRFLLSLVVRRTSAKEFLQCFLGGKRLPIAGLRVFETGLLVSHLRLDLAQIEPRARERLRCPPFLNALHKLLSNAESANEQVVIYGARGDMADQVFAAIQARGTAPIAAVVDRALSCPTLCGLPVWSLEHLFANPPDYVLVCATTSGPEILRTLEPLRGSSTLLPLYDVEASVWSVVLP